MLGLRHWRLLLRNSVSLLCGIFGVVCVWLRNIEDVVALYPVWVPGGVAGARAVGDGPDVMDTLFSITGLLGVGHFAVDAHGLMYSPPEEVVTNGWYKYWVSLGPVAYSWDTRQG
jgi:hypothetical protein